MLCKSCGKNIPANSVRCPECNAPTDFIKGLDGKEDNENMSRFTDEMGHGTFRNTNKMKELAVKNGEISEELKDSEDRYKKVYSIAIVEGILLIFVLVILIFGALFIVRNLSFTNGENNNTTSDAGNTSSVVSRQDTPSNVSSDVSSTVSGENVSSDVSSAEESAYDKIWKAIEGKTVKSVTGEDTRTIVITMSNEATKTYNVKFRTNGKYGATLKASVDESTGKLVGKTESDTEFTLEKSTDKDGAEIYVVTGTKFYYGKYYPD